METIRVWPLPPLEREEWVRLSARIEHPGKPARDLWFDVAKEWAPSVSTSSDAFAIAALFMGGADKSNVHVHGTVSPSLLRNLEELSLLWSLWRPGKYVSIGITAGFETESTPSHPDEAVACFSGGVDGCFTMYRHRRELCGRQQRNITAALLVQGFDIGIEETEQFSRATQSAEKSLRSLEIPLVRMRTNLRSFGLDWEDGFGSAMAASFSILKGRFGMGLLGSSERYDFMAPWGSTPLTDPMYSSDGFRVIHDGAGFSRTQKVEVMSQWQEGVANLRVCWEGSDPSRNCGRCEKCIRTILNFRAVGAGLPSCFNRDATDADIAGIQVRSAVHLNEFVSILEEAGKNGLLNAPWVKALAQRVARARRGRSFTQRLRDRLSLRTRLQAVYASFMQKEVCAS